GAGAGAGAQTRDRSDRSARPEAGWPGALQAAQGRPNHQRDNGSDLQHPRRRYSREGSRRRRISDEAARRASPGRNRAAAHGSTGDPGRRGAAMNVTRGWHEAAKPERDLERRSTGNTAADRVLGGGFPVNSINMIMGEPGTGKTLFAQQLVFHN